MRPKFIDKNAKIYLVAPSCGCSTTPYKEQLEASILNLKNKGYQIIEGNNIYKKRKMASNTAKKRAEEIMAAFKSDVDLIASVGGGEVMCQILPYIDFDKIKALKPIWYMGYSDNTFLSYTLTTICDIETIYGPHITKFYDDEFLYDKKDAIRMLEGEKTFESYGKYSFNVKDEGPLYKTILNKNSKMIVKNYNGSFEGILLGGCLDCLDILCGTKWDKTKEYIDSKNKPIIFYLEACDLTSAGIERTLFRLKNADWFKNVAGFIIGRSANNHKYFNISPKEAYLSELKEFNVPILLDCDLGHVGPSMPIRNGAIANVSICDNKLIINYLD